jgi:hypothetical protein
VSIRDRVVKPEWDTLSVSTAPQRHPLSFPAPSTSSRAPHNEEQVRGLPPELISQRGPPHTHVEPHRSRGSAQHSMHQFPLVISMWRGMYLGGRFKRMVEPLALVVLTKQKSIDCRRSLTHSRAFCEKYSFVARRIAAPSSASTDAQSSTNPSCVIFRCQYVGSEPTKPAEARRPSI